MAPVVRKCIAPLWARWERSAYLRHYGRLQRTQFDAPETVRARQRESLSRLLRHAYASTDFWRDRMDEAGFDPCAVESFEDLRGLPVLTKHELRQHVDRMISGSFDRSTLHRKSTSGSTGVPVEVYVDEAAQQFKRACLLRSDEWSGWRLGERVAKIWGNPEYLRRGWRGRLRNALLERAGYLDTLKMDEAAMRRFAAALRRKRPSLLFGHAHSLYLFSEFLRDRGGAGFEPRGIISSAMVLHDWERASIEEVFGCRVTNRYGSEEISIIACECVRHEGLHVNADGVYVEIVDGEGEPVGPGKAGRVLVTDLANRAMPMIRYEIGDMAAMSERGCSCGRGLPMIERIEGRAADYVVTDRGELISGVSLTENFAVLVPGIAQLQIVQEEVNRFTFRIVRGPEFGGESSARLKELVHARFGPSARYVCEYVERIAQEPSGKYRFCISRVPNPLLSQHRGAAAHAV